MIFFLLALPLLLWVKEPPRPVDREPAGAVARGALRDLADTARRARSYPELIRFLVGRAFYAEAANTIGLFLGIYLVVTLGFTSEQKDLLLLVGISAAIVGGIFWGFVVDRIGPRDSLMRVLAIWSVALALVAATGFGLLPNDALWAYRSPGRVRPRRHLGLGPPVDDRSRPAAVPGPVLRSLCPGRPLRGARRARSCGR